MKCDECRKRLSEYEAGELAEDEADAMREHLDACPPCAGALRTLRVVAGHVARLPEESPSEAVSLRILAQCVGPVAPAGKEAPEILTPEALARFLSVSEEDLADVIETIPAFEIAGQLRFRKQRVIEWIEAREKERERGVIYSQLRAV
jgi:anti-sigma factor RsiW